MRTDPNRHVTVWSHVRSGALVSARVDGTRGQFHVERDGDRITLTHARRECRRCPHPIHPAPGEEVIVITPDSPQYVAPPQDAVAERIHGRYEESGQARLAVALTQVRLGARPVAVVDERTGAMSCPAPDVSTKAGRADLLHHLYLFHNLDDVEELKGSTLLDTHEHAPAAKEHDHTLNPH